MPPAVDTKKCKGAAACAEVCPTNVIDIVKGRGRATGRLYRVSGLRKRLPQQRN